MASEKFVGELDRYDPHALSRMQLNDPLQYDLILQRHIQQRMEWRRRNPEPIKPGCAPYPSDEAFDADLRLAGWLGLQFLSYAPRDLHEPMSRYRKAAYAAADMDFIDPEEVIAREKTLVAPYASIADVYFDVALLLEINLLPTELHSMGFERLFNLAAPFREAYRAAQGVN